MVSGTEEWLLGVWGSSETNVFAVGTRGTLLHYDGLQWELLQSGTTQDLHAVWGSSAENIYIVGKKGTILKGNGDSWSSVESGASENLWGIWGSSEDDIYVTGDHSIILHWDGIEWTTMSSGSNAWIMNTWGSSATDVFAVGGFTDDDAEYETIPALSGGAVLHFDGVRWSEMLVQDTGPLVGIWGSSATNVFVVGSAGTILHYDGIGGSRQENCVIEEICGITQQQLILLRHVRDSVLTKTPAGQKLIALYYHLNPTILQVLNRNDRLRTLANIMINAVLAMLEK